MSTIPLLDIETQRCYDSLDYVLEHEGSEAALDLLRRLGNHLSNLGVFTNNKFSTPYVNTIPFEEEPEYPGDEDMEQSIRNILRWNAMAMVVRANNKSKGIGGHISTYSSIAHLWEVGFNHFFKMDRSAGSPSVPAAGLFGSSGSNSMSTPPCQVSFNSTADGSTF